jgi:hypothetical protein
VTDTDQLIEKLATQAAPVRPIASPLRRTVWWLVLAAAVIAVLVASVGIRPDWLHQARASYAGVEWAGAVLTGLLATYATFQISVPGRSPAWAWLPVPAVALWLGGIGLGCLQEFAHFGVRAFAFEAASSECARAITLTSLPLGLALLIMVRHAGVVRPVPTAVLTALGAAASSAAGVSLIHSGESALMVLLWHAGAVAVLCAASGWTGRRVLAWLGPARGRAWPGD